MSFFSHSMQMLLWRILTIGFGALTAILLARFLGPEARGELAIILLSIALGAIIFQAGIPEALIYVIGSKRFEDDVIVKSLIVYMAGLLAAFSLSFYFVMKNYFDEGSARIFILISIFCVVVLLTLLRHLLLSFKEFGAFSVSIFLESFFYFVSVIFLYWDNQLSVDTVLGFFFISNLISLLYVLIQPSISLGGVWAGVFSFPIVKECYKFGFHLFIVGMGGFGVQRISFFLIESYSGSRAVGLYSAASTIPTLFANLPQQIATVLYTYVSADRSKLEDGGLVLLLFKLILMLFILLIIPTIYFVDEIVLMLFGSEFVTMANTMALLVVGMFISGLSIIIFNFLAGLGLHYFGSYLSVISLILVSLVGVILIPRFGIAGAAITQIVVFSVNLIVMIVVFLNKTGRKFSELIVPNSLEIAILFGLYNSAKKRICST